MRPSAWRVMSIEARMPWHVDLFTASMLQCQAVRGVAASARSERYLVACVEMSGDDIHRVWLMSQARRAFQLTRCAEHRHTWHADVRRHRRAMARREAKWQSRFVRR